MRIWIFIILISVFLFNSAFLSTACAYENQINKLSNSLAEKIPQTNKKIIAVVDFTDLQGNVTELGRFFAQEIQISLLTMSKGFEIVDRTHLNSILAEHKLATKGIIDPQTARKLGKIAGVEALITGTITLLGDNIRLTAMVLDTETAKVITASRENIPLTSSIESLLKTEIKTISKKKDSSKRETDIKEINEVESSGFLFKPLGCILRGNDLFCSILFKYKGDKNKFFIIEASTSTGSTFYDEIGNIYRENVKVQIGDSRPSSYIHHQFIPEVPTKVVYEIKGFNGGELSRVTAILGMQARDGGSPFQIQLDNIPIN